LADGAVRRSVTGAGPHQAIHFKDGDIVQKGQLLFELDPRPFQVEINQALANAKAFEAKVAAEKTWPVTELLNSGGRMTAA
jgi:multidrug efflux pump subunit AcrA (membrane-fusion protein)